MDHGSARGAETDEGTETAIPALGGQGVFGASLAAGAVDGQPVWKLRSLARSGGDQYQQLAMTVEPNAAGTLWSAGERGASITPSVSSRFLRPWGGGQVFGQEIQQCCYACRPQLARWCHEIDADVGDPPFR
ncbi:hypothetical protein D9M70_560000 [compost metagenome]